MYKLKKFALNVLLHIECSTTDLFYMDMLLQIIIAFPIKFFINHIKEYTRMWVYRIKHN